MMFPSEILWLLWVSTAMASFQNGQRGKLKSEHGPWLGYAYATQTNVVYLLNSDYLYAVNGSNLHTLQRIHIASISNHSSVDPGLASLSPSQHNGLSSQPYLKHFPDQRLLLVCFASNCALFATHNSTGEDAPWLNISGGIFALPKAVGNLINTVVHAWTPFSDQKTTTDPLSHGLAVAHNVRLTAIKFNSLPLPREEPVREYGEDSVQPLFFEQAKTGSKINRWDLTTGEMLAEDNEPDTTVESVLDQFEHEEHVYFVRNLKQKNLHELQYAGREKNHSEESTTLLRMCNDEGRNIIPRPDFISAMEFPLECGPHGLARGSYLGTRVHFSKSLWTLFIHFERTNKTQSTSHPRQLICAYPMQEISKRFRLLAELCKKKSNTVFLLQQSGKSCDSVSIDTDAFDKCGTVSSQLPDHWHLQSFTALRGYLIKYNLGENPIHAMMFWRSGLPTLEYETQAKPWSFYGDIYYKNFTRVQIVVKRLKNSASTGRLLSTESIAVSHWGGDLLPNETFGIYSLPPTIDSINNGKRILYVQGDTVETVRSPCEFYRQCFECQRIAETTDGTDLLEQDCGWCILNGTGGCYQHKRCQQLSHNRQKYGRVVMPSECPPDIEKMEPSGGSWYGGDHVTLFGRNFIRRREKLAAVKICGAECNVVSVMNDRSSSGLSRDADHAGDRCAAGTSAWTKTPGTFHCRAEHPGTPQLRTANCGVERTEVLERMTLHHQEHRSLSCVTSAFTEEKQCAVSLHIGSNRSDTFQVDYSHIQFGYERIATQGMRTVDYIYISLAAFLLVIFAIALATYCYLRRRRKCKLDGDNSSFIYTPGESGYGNVSHHELLPLNPVPTTCKNACHERPCSLPLSSPFTPNSMKEYNSSNVPTVISPYESLRDSVPEAIRIPLELVDFDMDSREVLGEGHFGRVYKGKYNHPGGDMQDVAVKMIRGGDCNLQSFLQEGILMHEFEDPHVLSLVGISFTNSGYPMILTPFMARGDLHTYISDERNQPTVRQLLNFAEQIAEGMRYLHKLKFVHRDLAARNCMLDENFRIRIADFGLCRDIYDSDVYVSEKRLGDLPLRWMAPESIEKAVYTLKSDIWSYGVLAWELMTRGLVPYVGVEMLCLLDFLKRGNRLSQPPCCPKELYTVMRHCWCIAPRDRPDFAHLVDEIPKVVKALRDAEHNWRSMVAPRPPRAQTDNSAATGGGRYATQRTSVSLDDCTLLSVKGKGSALPVSVFKGLDERPVSLNDLGAVPISQSAQSVLSDGEIPLVPGDITTSDGGCSSSEYFAHPDDSDTHLDSYDELQGAEPSDSVPPLSVDDAAKGFAEIDTQDSPEFLDADDDVLDPHWFWDSNQPIQIEDDVDEAGYAMIDDGDDQMNNNEDFGSVTQATIHREDSNYNPVEIEEVGKRDSLANGIVGPIKF